MTHRCPTNTSPSPLRLRAGVALSLLMLLLALPVRAQIPASVQSLVTEGSQAGADPALLETVATRAGQAGLSSGQTRALLRPAVTLAQQDLPSTPLLNKALEGLAKQVPPQRMGPVLQQIQTHTTEAGALVGTWTQRSDVQALLEADPSDAARDRLITNVAEARQQNVPLDRVKQFLEAVPPAALARGTAQAIKTGAPASRVLQDLFRGTVPGGPPADAGPDAPPGQSNPPDETGRPPDAGPPNTPAERPSPPPDRGENPGSRPNG